MQPLLFIEFTPGPEGLAFDVFSRVHQALHLSIVEQGRVLAVDYPQARFSKPDGARLVRGGWVGERMRVFANEETALTRFLQRSELNVLLDIEALLRSSIQPALGLQSQTYEWKKSRTERLLNPSRQRRELARREKFAAQGITLNATTVKLQPSVRVELYSFSTGRAYPLYMTRTPHTCEAQLGVPNFFGLSCGDTFLPG